MAKTISSTKTTLSGALSISKSSSTTSLSSHVDSTFSLTKKSISPTSSADNHSASKESSNNSASEQFNGNSLVDKLGLLCSGTSTSTSTSKSEATKTTLASEIHVVKKVKSNERNGTDAFKYSLKSKSSSTVVTKTERTVVGASAFRKDDARTKTESTSTEDVGAAVAIVDDKSAGQTIDLIRINSIYVGAAQVRRSELFILLYIIQLVILICCVISIVQLFFADCTTKLSCSRVTLRLALRSFSCAMRSSTKSPGS